jgi:RNA polymerase sigma-70 factor (ECF subfamily)
VEPRSPTTGGESFERAWHEERQYVLALATRMLGDRAAAEDVVQEAFGRLATAGADTIDDVRGWLAVVVRRLSLNRLTSAYQRRETAVDQVGEPMGTTAGATFADPVDRITLDDQVRLALAVLLDRLTPAERTAFLLHDVFGFPFDSVGEIVGRTPGACRQLASRARRSIRDDAGRATTGTPSTQPTDGDDQSVVAERFIAACAGGDLHALLEVLDPDVAGVATFLGRGTIIEAQGADEVAARIVVLFGPRTDSVLVPIPLDETQGLVAFRWGRVVALIELHVEGGRVHHIHSHVRPPR